MPSVPDEFYRIQKLPPYVFAVINEMKAKARAAQTGCRRSGDGQSGWRHARSRGQQADRSRAQSAQPSLFACRAASRGCATRSSSATRANYGVELDPETRSHRHHRRQGRAGAPAVRRDRPGRRGGFPEPRLPDSPVRRASWPKGTPACFPCPTRHVPERLEDLYRTSPRSPR